MVIIFEFRKDCFRTASECTSDIAILERGSHSIGGVCAFGMGKDK